MANPSSLSPDRVMGVEHRKELLQINFIPGKVHYCERDKITLTV
jgi:hypothetical protein